MINARAETLTEKRLSEPDRSVPLLVPAESRGSRAPPAEAAHALSVSRDFFEEHVLPELRVVRRGRLVPIPVSELQRWCARNAARTMEGYGPS